MSKERLLDGIELIFSGDSFDSPDFCPFGLQRGNQAAVDQQAVDFDCAGAAFTFTAAFFCAGQMGLVTKNIE